MKTLSVFILGMILLISLCLGIMTLVISDAKAANEQCHEVYDVIEGEWWCIGAAVNCDCSTEIRQPK